MRLIDGDERIAQGKALDILQSSPVERFRTRVTGAGAIAAAAGADAIVLADAANGQGEHSGESGLALLRQLAAIETAAPILFAGATQRELMARAATELHLPEPRVIGSAPLALESAVRAVAGLAIDASGVEVSLGVVGVPPRSAVVAWEAATAFAQPLACSSAARDRRADVANPGPLAAGAVHAGHRGVPRRRGARERFTPPLFVFREHRPRAESRPCRSSSCRTG